MVSVCNCASLEYSSLGWTSYPQGKLGELQPLVMTAFHENDCCNTFREVADSEAGDSLVKTLVLLQIFRHSLCKTWQFCAVEQED